MSIKIGAYIHESLYSGHNIWNLVCYKRTNMSGFAIAGIGFVPGLSLAVTGLITSIQQKGNRKIRTGKIFNSIGMLINIANGNIIIVSLLIAKLGADLGFAFFVMREQFFKLTIPEAFDIFLFETIFMR